MTLDISFAELTEYVSAHYGKNLTFSMMSQREICVAYGQRVLGMTIQIPVNLAIDEVKPDAISVTYSGKLGIDKVISGALMFIEAKVPKLQSVLKAEDGHRLHVSLTDLDATKKVVEKVTLRDILIVDNAIRIVASMK